MKKALSVFAYIKQDKGIKSLFYANIAILITQAVYIAAYIRYLPVEIPLWYTKNWGEGQLARPIFILVIPVTVLLIISCAAILGSVFAERNYPEIAKFISSILTFLNIILAYSLYRIITISSLPAPNFPESKAGKILLPLFTSALVTYFVSPLIIKLTHKFGIIDDPTTHKHPAILHKIPVPRAGAIPFFIGFLASALIFIQNPQYLTAHYLVGLYVGVAIAITVGVIDDKYDLNPYLRLGLLSIAAVVIILSGVRALYVDNPINSVLRLDSLKFQFEFFGKREIVFWADIFSLLWVLWVANMLSWSNGVDGQFSGIVAITAIIIAVLSLRPGTEGGQGEIATLAAATAGGALGLLSFTWHPAKIFWGFGATGVGIIIAVLSIFSGTKVATASLVLMVPLLDALYAIIRRVRAGKSPFFGDRAHLHHKLLDRGWSHQRIAIFYWLATAILGGIALVCSDKSKLLAIITAGGLVGFLIAMVSLGGERGKQKLLKLAAKVPKDILPSHEKDAEKS